jgi:DNA polymerase-3 subunit epsilon
MGFLDRLSRSERVTAPPPPRPGLGPLAGGADRVTVVDCETTGVYNSDRIVEIAIVTLDLDGQVIDTWDTLVQPQRDVGASHIHGLTATCLRDAPTFDDVAGDVALRLHGACLAAHNLPFDKRMLCNEFARLGTDLSVVSGLDTLTATRARLAVACAQRQIPLHDAHSALADATATAALLQLVAAARGIGSPSAAPPGLTRSGRVLRRGDIVPATIPDPPHLVALAAALDHDGLEGNVLAYLELVGWALADLHLDASERAELALLAGDLGLGEAQVAQAHRRFVNDLIEAALDDDIVTEDEYDTLLRVAQSLGVETDTVEMRTRSARATTATVELSAGMSVTFTGDDPLHTREALKAHAADLTMTVGGNVTKATDLLVAYDTSSNSGKAGKARTYSVPIVSTAQFAAAVVGDVLEAETSEIEGKKVVTCPECHKTWTVPGRSGAKSTRRCEDCAPARTPASATPRPSAARSTEPLIETLTCTSCGTHWSRERVRGRKPQRCPACVAGEPSQEEPAPFQF